MKPLFSVLILLLCFDLATTSSRADLLADITAEAETARKILDSWHAQNPRQSKRTLHLVYWTPSDREPAAAYRERLTRIFEDIRKFYATEMQRIGFGPRTIDLDYADDKQLNIHLVKGAGPFADYGMQDGSKIRTECLPTLREAGIDPDRETIVIFCNMATWDEASMKFTHKSPYYAGGNASHGTAWQLDSPILDIKNLALKEPKMHDGQYGHISLGKHNSIFIGGVAHELGHALGLPHNRERADERKAFGTALMGSGNRSYGDQLRGEGRGSFLTLAHAMRLASHPQFSGSIKGLNTPTRAKFSDFKITSAESSFSVSGKITCPTPAYAVVAYMDPAGGSDYDAPTTTAVPDKDGNFTLNCSALKKNSAAELNIVACLANGSTHRKSFPYTVDADGQPDLSTVQLKLALAPVVAAINAQDPNGAKKALKLDDPKAREILNRLLTKTKHEKTPAEIGGKAAQLSDTKPKLAKVGWMRPTYNRLPNRNLVIESGSKLFATGIYAHAPAEHHYELGKKWNQLSGECGIAAGSRGSVVFVIRVDGEERWRSPTTKGGTVHRYSIDLSDAEELQLVVEHSGDGAGSHWGLWLAPTLTR